MNLVCLCGNEISPALGGLGSTRCHDCRADARRHSEALEAAQCVRPLVDEIYHYLEAVALTRSLKGQGESVHNHVRATATTRKPILLLRLTGATQGRLAERRM